jgi:exopolysaccharide production protein ExoY
MAYSLGEARVSSSADVLRQPILPGEHAPLSSGPSATEELPDARSPAGGAASARAFAGAAEAARSFGAGSDIDWIRPLGGQPKRAIDVAVAAAGLILAAPIMLMIVLLIRTTSNGPAIFAHRRVGFRGRPFQCYKFRTMVADSASVLAEHLARNPQAAREWRETRKLRQDPRVTLLGRVLRKSSLDELPQLYNILRGDMSCVGPRPVVHDELEHYGTFAAEYLRARPGLTGLWQVTGRSSTDYSSRILLDTQYVRNWSLWRDLVIICRTSVAVLRFHQVC